MAEPQENTQVNIEEKIPATETTQVAETPQADNPQVDNPVTTENTNPAESSQTNGSSVHPKPAVLIIGGLGYIGRWLALYIHNNNLASEVRLVDKVLPELAFLAPDFAEACSKDKFMQADAVREQNYPRIFQPVNAPQYDYVFNCGGETRHSQDDSVYLLRSVALTKALASECARRRTPAYIEFSTGTVYKPPNSSLVSSGGCTETSPLKPWLKLARHKLTAEEELDKIAKAAQRDRDLNSPSAGELRYAILRLPHVYGPYDVGFLARGLCLARVYQSKHEEMKWLYGRDLRVNTLHVLDAASAAWLAAEWAAGHGTFAADSHPLPSASNASPAASSPPAAPTPAPPPPRTHNDRIFNISDHGDTSQGDIASLISSAFHIPTGFQNTLVSAFAKLNLEAVVDEVNDDVLQPWAELLHERGITRTVPIGPFMEKELLRDCGLCLSSERAGRVLGWRVGKGRERLDGRAIAEVLGSFGRMGWWP